MSPDDLEVPGPNAAPRGAFAPATTEPAVLAVIEASLREVAAKVEATVRGSRAEVVAHAAWWTGDPDPGAMGGLVLVNDRGNKQLGVEWVPGDPRRNGRFDVGYAFLAFVTLANGRSTSRRGAS